MIISNEIPKSIRDLRIEDFYTLLDLISTSSFSKTAKNRGITQSAVSHRIKEIERAFGNLKLFDRTSRTFTLKPEGNSVMVFSENLLKHLSQLVKELEKISERSQIYIFVASSSIPGEYLLPKLFMHFQKKHPEYMFQIKISNTKRSITQLFSDKTRFCAVGNIDGLRDLDYKIIGEDEIRIIARRNHPIFEKIEKMGYYRSNPHIYELLLECPWIFREKGSATREIFLQECPVRERIIPSLELHNNTAIIHAVENSNALSALSSYSLNSLGKDAKILPVEHPSLKKIKRKFYLVKRKNTQLTPAELAFWDYCNANK